MQGVGQAQPGGYAILCCCHIMVILLSVSTLQNAGPLPLWSVTQTVTAYENMSATVQFAHQHGASGEPLITG
jgi:hypothetical protein